MPNYRMHMIVGASFIFLSFAAWFYFLWPMQRQAVRAAGWKPAAATVVSSGIAASRESASATYRVVIEYTYEFNGRRYTGERYGFSEVATSDREQYEAVVAAYPPGAEVTCYVDPADPSRAVLDRNTPQEFYTISGLLAIPFLVGVFIVLLTSWKQRRYLRAMAA